jgi:hypothetical protein
MKKLGFLLATGGKSKEQIVREITALAREAGMLKEPEPPKPREPEQLNLPFPVDLSPRR